MGKRKGKRDVLRFDRAATLGLIESELAKELGALPPGVDEVEVALKRGGKAGAAMQVAALLRLDLRHDSTRRADAFRQAAAKATKPMQLLRRACGDAYEFSVVAAKIAELLAAIEVADKIADALAAPPGGRRRPQGRLLASIQAALLRGGWEPETVEWLLDPVGAEHLSDDPTAEADRINKRIKRDNKTK